MNYDSIMKFSKIFLIILIKMTSIIAIPISDIKEFLLANNQEIPLSNRDIYLAAWDLIKSGQIQYAPPSISDFIIAIDLASQGFKSSLFNLQNYKISDILVSNDKNLQDLSTFLTLPFVDKQRIIRILGYLHILDNDI